MPVYLFWLICLLCIPAVASAQPEFSGKVLIQPGNRPAPGVSIISQTRGYVGSTRNDGTFSLKAEKQEKLFLFYPGFQTIAFSAADSADASSYYFSFNIGLLSTGSSQAVVIRPKKTLEDIEEERKKLGEIPKELEQPEMSFTSPISALYELLSDRARERAKLRQQIVEDNRKRIFRELFRYYRERELFDLPEEYDEEFIRFLDLPLDFLKYNSDYTIMQTILERYKRFALQEGIRK